MHDQPNPGQLPLEPPQWGTRRHQLQRVVMLELLTDPPEAGDKLSELAGALGEPLHEIAAAVGELIVVGLVERYADAVRATPTANWMEALWPIAV